MFFIALLIHWNEYLKTQTKHRVYYSDPKNKEDLVAAYKDVILPLSAVKKQLTARDLEIAQKKKEHRYLGVWMFLCMLLGNQFVHFLHPVDRV